MAECREGMSLFTLASLSLVAGDCWWIGSTLARLAYIDHCNGWQRGDVKVQRQRGYWTISVRSCGHWILQCVTQDEHLLEEWLRCKGYRQYVQLKNKHLDYRLGYYHKDPAQNSEDDPFLKRTLEGGEASALFVGQRVAVSLHDDGKHQVDLLHRLGQLCVINTGGKHRTTSIVNERWATKA